MSCNPIELAIIGLDVYIYDPHGDGDLVGHCHTRKISDSYVILYATGLVDSHYIVVSYILQPIIHVMKKLVFIW